ncbi:MAG: hypothetical protein NZ602_02000 [Thermoguttaceae bacterium]|nr:hypothetical protein [Thermoguttaceae bacterium]MDW8037772.1 hypothetical protein [Thermoguttaceae bacterium]
MKVLSEAQEGEAVGGKINSVEDVPVRLSRTGAGMQGLIIVLAVVFLLTSIHRLHPTDLWGHLNYGRWIVQHGGLPEADPFRPGLPSESFVATWWLSQVIGYGWYRLFGLEGLVAGHAVLVTLMVGMLIGATAARGVPMGWSVTAGVTGCLLAIPILGVIRPQLFGMVAFAATLWAAAQMTERWKPLFWLVPLFALWANLHGSFLVGLVALACHVVGVGWERLWSLSSGQRAGWRQRFFWLLWDKAIWRTAAALVLAIAASCLNPEGPKLLATVAAFSSHEPLRSISEWRPMTVQSLSGLLMLSSVLATGVLLRWSPRRVWASEVLLGLVFGVGAFTAIRMLAWWAIVWPWLVAPHAAAVALRYGKTHSPKHVVSDAYHGKRWAITLAVVVLCLWWSPPVHSLLTGQPRPPESILSKDTPEPLAQFLLDRQIQGRMYAPMQWADYLVWRTEGAVVPLVHCHVHLIPAPVWEDFLAFEQTRPIWPQLADKYRLDYLIVHRRENPLLASALQRHPRSELLWEDSQAMLARWKKAP